MTTGLSPDLAPCDLLGRRVFSGRRAKRAEKEAIIEHDIFLPPKGKNCISADRLGIESDADMTVLVTRIDDRGDKFKGWGCVTQKQASENGRSVRAVPVQETPYHADICFPDAVIKNDLKLKESAYELAEYAVWCKKAASILP